MTNSHGGRFDLQRDRDPTPPRDGRDSTGVALEEILAKTWGTPPGWRGWLTTVDHKRIGHRYIVTAFIFFVLAGILALLMRAQLATPESGLISADRYNQIFSMHGTTMMFLFAVPVMEAMAVYLVPLMAGTRNIAFPRLNAFSYWIYLFGGVMIWIAFFMNIGPETGWFSYVPLAEKDFSPTKRTDFWAQMITFTEVSALAVAVEVVATILKMRAPGMSLNRMPLFLWAMLLTSFMIIFAMPAVMLSSSMLISDRLVSTKFFIPDAGGDALLWQHLFWFFGHPEVYIIFMPALGFVSQITETFSRRPIFGYPAMVLALVTIAFMAFGLWVHHMFATGLPRLGYTFYTVTSMMIAIPSGVQIFCWIATLYLGRPRLTAPLLYVIGFVINFVIGGLTGVMVASVPLDLQVHDTYFVVAHFHYTLIGGAVFPLLGAVHYWFPKITGRMLGEKFGKIIFWWLLAAFNVTFFPMHISGLLGMPRRVYTYQPGLGWDIYNQISSFGAFAMAVALILFLVNIFRSLRVGTRAGDNPWRAPSLEWASASPPPAFNFAHIPVVDSRAPLWTQTEALPVMTGLRIEDRELLLTTVLDAEPDVREPSPEPTLWPLLSAIAATGLLIGSIYTPWAITIGAIPVSLALIAWFWPKGPPSAEPVMK